MCLSGHADVAQMSKVSSSSTSLQDDIPQVFHLDAKGNDSSFFFCSCSFFFNIFLFFLLFSFFFISFNAFALAVRHCTSFVLGFTLSSQATCMHF